MKRGSRSESDWSHGVPAPSDRASEAMTGSNSNSVRTEHEASGIDLPSDTFRVGVDESGREHWFSPYNNHVWVFRDGGLVHDRDVGSIVDWVLEYERQLGSWREREPVEESGGLGTLVDDIDCGDGVVTDGGRPRESIRTCARCDSDAVDGSRYCDEHGPLATDGGHPYRIGDPIMDAAQGRPMVVVATPEYTVAEWSNSNDYDLAGNYANAKFDPRADEPVVECVYVSDVRSEPSKTYTFPVSRCRLIDVHHADDGRRLYDRVVRDVLEALFATAASEAMASSEGDIFDLATHADFDEDVVEEARELADVERTIGSDDAGDDGSLGDFDDSPDPSAGGSFES